MKNTINQFSSAPTRKIAFLVEYDGTDFFGWQRQVTERTVQATFEAALEDLTGEPGPVVVAAGRTDSGVHARGQVACFRTKRRWPADVFMRALPERLPSDVCARAAWDAPIDFNPRGEAIRRLYSYRLWNRPHTPVIDRRLWTHCPVTLDFGRVREASKRLLGQHDFVGFRSSRCQAKRTRLTIERLEWTEIDDGLWVMEIASRSFLHHMVRTIVGTLIDIGRGAANVDMIERIIETGDRKLAGPTARPEGLTLERVEYPEGRTPLNG